MKIFFPIGAFFPSQIGGPCNTLYWHTLALSKRNIEVFVVTSTTGIKKGAVPENIFIDTEFGKIYYGKGTIFQVRTIINAIKMIGKVDLIHLNSLFSVLSIFVFFYSRLFYSDKRIIWSVRGELNKNALFYSRWKKTPLLFLYKLLKRNSVFHSTSDEESKDIFKIFPDSRVIQIPNLIYPTKRIKKNTSNYLIFLGRIHPIKSLDNLIKALDLSKAFKRSNFELYIFGDNEARYFNYKEELKNLISKLNLQTKIFFKGHIEGEDKEFALANAYALILPSKTENFGNVVIESLNQGTPVIASTGTPWEILEHYKAGYHCSNEPAELAKTIDKILTLDPHNYENMVSNCVKLVDDNFNVNTGIKDWVNIYKEVVSENNK